MEMEQVGELGSEITARLRLGSFPRLTEIPIRPDRERHMRKRRQHPGEKHSALIFDHLTVL